MVLNVLQIYAQIVTLSLLLLDFISELYLKKGNHGNHINYTKHNLFQMRLYSQKVYLTPQTSSRIKSLNIKQNFRRERGRCKIKPRKWDYISGVNKCVLRQLDKFATVIWNIRITAATLVNIESLKYKIDTLLHHVVTLKTESA